MGKGVRVKVSPAPAAFLIHVLERGIRGERAVASDVLSLARELNTKAQVFSEAVLDGDAKTDLQAGTGHHSALQARPRSAAAILLRRGGGRSCGGAAWGPGRPGSRARIRDGAGGGLTFILAPGAMLGGPAFRWGAPPGGGGEPLLF